MREHHIEVTRTARYHTLGDPARPLRQVWFVCHGHGQLAARFLRRFQPIDDGSRLIVAPEALNRFYVDGASGPHGPDSRVGATWMTREDRLAEIDDYVRYLDALYARTFEEVDRDAVEVFALGFSQGAATVSRWAAFGAARLDRLVLWASFLAHDLVLDAAADRLRALRPILVAGEEDPYAPPAAAHAEADRLRALGIDATVLAFSGGHALDDATLRRIAGGEV
jgi:predicted esterase